MPTQLDPTIVNLTKAIRQTESGGNFSAKGASGEYGAYQFLPTTFTNLSQKYLGQKVDLQSATPQQQNEVAYKQMADWKAKGYNVGQIASMWNAGEGEPNAYTGTFSNGKPAVGTNSMGVKFDVPTYAKKVATNYQTFKQQTGGTTTDVPQPEQSPSVGGFVQNTFSSAGKVLGGLGQAVMHPIDTVSNIASTAAGGVEKLFGANNQDTQNFDNLVNVYKNKYGGSSIGEVAKNIAHTFYTDPVGTALDLSVVLDGAGAVLGRVGQAGDIAKASELAKTSDFISTTKGILDSGSPEAIKALQTPGTLTKISDALKTAADYSNPITAIGKGAGSLLNVGGKLASESLGLTTGAGSGAIKGAFQAGTEGGAAASAFRSGISGGEESVNALAQTATDAFKQIKSDQQTAYQTQLEAIKNGEHTLTSETIKPIVDKFDELLNKFDVIKGKNGELDFSNSNLESEAGSMTDIKQISQKIEQYRKGTININPSTIDKLKQFIADRYTGGSRGSAFTTPLADTVRTVLKKNVSGYEKLTGDYAQTARDLKDIQQGLSVGGKAAKETLVKKLTNAIKGNNEYRKTLLAQLENRGGENITAQASGVALGSLAPQGLTKYTEGLGLILNPHLVMALPFESPRIVGEFVLALGKGNRALTNIGNAFIKYGGDKVLKVETTANKAKNDQNP